MDNRSKNGVRNIEAGLVNKLILMLLPFATRTLIVYKLGEEYLGISSLFTSILMVLNLTELGFGSALVFGMYKPIAEGNTAKVCGYLNLYRKIYRGIGIGIIIVAILLSPFLNKIIKGDVPSDINLYIVYFIYIANTALTYLIFAYKKALLTAYQRSDVLSNVSTLIGIGSNVLQIVLLLIIPNFYFFVIVLPLSTFCENLLVSRLTDKRFPEIKPEGFITTEEKGKLKEHVKGIALQKICSASRNSFDSIVISMFLGLRTIAIYGNYYLIMGALHDFLYQIPNSIRATVGNSVVSESIDKNYKDFCSMYLLYMWLCGWCATYMFTAFQPFMKLWMGESLMFPLLTVGLICFYFILLSLSDIIALYKDGAGLWWYGRYRVGIEAVANLILNFVMGCFWGVNGILMATILTLLFIGHGYGGWIVFHYYFKGKQFTMFVANQIGYILIIAFTTFVNYKVCNLLPMEGIPFLIFSFMITLVLANILYWAIFRIHPHYKDAIRFSKNIISVAKKK